MRRNTACGSRCAITRAMNGKLSWVGWCGDQSWVSANCQRVRRITRWLSGKMQLVSLTLACHQLPATIFQHVEGLLQLTTSLFLHSSDPAASAAAATMTLVRHRQITGCITVAFLYCTVRTWIKRGNFQRFSSSEFEFDVLNLIVSSSFE